jgi:hypothetical protein
LDKISGVHVGDEFIYQAEMYLVDLYDDLVHRISLGIYDVIEVKVVTCAGAVYHIHNIFLDEDLVIY